MALFQNTEFTGHAGGTLPFKIECDELSDADIETLAKIIARKFSLKEVQGIPRGGDRLAKALEKYCSPVGETVLLVDDVLTSGMSMEEARRELGDSVQGVVIFARGTLPDWVEAVFVLSDWAR